MSHPTRVRGLKLFPIYDNGVMSESHPTRVRGLKPSVRLLGYYYLLSHPTRVRGLKLDYIFSAVIGSGVAPHAGAWIET